LSEIKNHENSDDEEVSFYDNLKSIRDASMPGLTSPRGGDTIPTPVIPFSDVKLSDLERFVIHGQG
jgi:hypothetical protein